MEIRNFINTLRLGSTFDSSSPAVAERLGVSMDELRAADDTDLFEIAARKYRPQPTYVPEEVAARASSLMRYPQDETKLRKTIEEISKKLSVPPQAKAA